MIEEPEASKKPSPFVSHWKPVSLSIWFERFGVFEASRTTSAPTSNIARSEESVIVGCKIGIRSITTVVATNPVPAPPLGGPGRLSTIRYSS